ncbi:hypothetical protein [Clostridium luticellarii]|jgi:uncharacterized Tic20 family protein|uniref:DUF3784 domain-containing protein n=1 Tax=Clostridium luticellarii TaxID=1691940 RepID=A0A2T0BJD2_9CLOT|nr:hypothetical protein [Clostridium luticellarii]MCI1944066.1 hypothetical protein [Clostridium luticellarii]MCI1967292.1 hypothetical protein [Clostridium luticellarii]MCI1995204.1 hypothetical protein [Clostridium luticellarii]MCI2039300.1 hypothetical protein [Clostridium luticellarii]PRR83994.1 hypothetical protein CLLU_25370 [Clostridium luticellarii]
MDSTITGLLTLLGFMGIIQGLGMKYSKSVRKKFMLDAEGVDKKYVNFKINFLIVMGVVILLFELVTYFYPQIGTQMEILLSAFLLLAITSDFIYKKTRNKRKNK